MKISINSLQISLTIGTLMPFIAQKQPTNVPKSGKVKMVLYVQLMIAKVFLTFPSNVVANWANSIMPGAIVTTITTYFSNNLRLSRYDKNGTLNASIVYISDSNPQILRITDTVAIITCKVIFFLFILLTEFYPYFDSLLLVVRNYVRFFE